MIVERGKILKISRSIEMTPMLGTQSLDMLRKNFGPLKFQYPFKILKLEASMLVNLNDLLLDEIGEANHEPHSILNSKIWETHYQS